MLKFKIIILVLSFAPFVSAQKNTGERAKWFVNDRLGMFIHWGVYSSAEGVWKGEELRNNNQYAEWIQYRNRISKSEYLTLLDRFDWESIDPEKWVILAKESGMKYITLTAKHHDGFALWESQSSDYNIYNKSNKDRDIVKELADACKKHGLKIGLYYSHWIDWEDERSWDHTKEVYGIDYKNYDRYWQEKVIPQMTELLTNYGEISIIWFDMWIHHSRTIVSKQQLFQLKNLIRKLQPNCLINSRLGLSIEEDKDVDFRTLGDNQLGKEKYEYPWQTPATIAHSWGYNSRQDKWKSTSTILKSLIGNVSLNGNLMLNIGPRADGSLPYEALSRLNEMGDWLKKNGNSIYGSEAFDLRTNLHDWGTLTYKEINDNKHYIFLHIFNWPLKRLLKLTGISSIPKKIYSLSDTENKSLNFKHKSVLTEINLPKNPFDKYVSVIVLEYDKKPVALKGLVAESGEGGYSLNLENYNYINGDGKINEAKKYGTIPKNILVQKKQILKWKIFISEPGEYSVDSSYSFQDNKDGGNTKFEINDTKVKQKFKSTGKTVGEPLQDWVIDNYKSNKLGSFKINKTGIYEVTLSLESIKDPVKWQWLWIESKK
jgi:alpha-L-fucosidase